MRQTMMSLIVFIATVVGMFVFNVVFGQAYDQMFFAFNTTQSTLGLPTQWATVATGVLAKWNWVYSAQVVIIISVGIWVVLTIINEHDYSRERF